MRRLSVFVILGILALLCLCISAQAKLLTGPPANAMLAQSRLQLGVITRNQLLLQIEKEVEVEGFYYDGSIPMVVDSMETVRMDRVMPLDKYVPIVGPRPTGLGWGAKIKIRGRVQRPTAGDPQGVQGQNVILRVGDATQIQVLAASVQLYSPLAQVRITSKFAGRITVNQQDKYAILIAGGWNAANSHLRYWHDLVAMYNILKNAGYAPANIYVIYANGVARDGSIPVNYSATKANISTVFTQLAAKMDGLDTLYIMTNDHGDLGTGDPSGDETITHTDEALCLWNQVLMTDDEFAVELNKIQAYDKIIMQMKQCFSGGLIDDLTKPNRILMSSSSATQVSYGRMANDYGEFTFWYFSALTGNKPDGTGAVNADANGDGKVSILEAWNFARSQDTAPETPQYEDNGVKPAHAGPMPAGGEGVLGAATYL